MSTTVKKNTNEISWSWSFYMSTSLHSYQSFNRLTHFVASMVPLQPVVCFVLFFPSKNYKRPHTFFFTGLFIIYTSLYCHLSCSKFPLLTDLGFQHFPSFLSISCTPWEGAKKKKSVLMWKTRALAVSLYEYSLLSPV